ncbi:CBBY-like protein isoform X2 [Malania oleifera]|uniref:CBBY-like protein isoform X2 n=1 Tax=Malania oleifera TaxID=397392 RepID=UPI0025AE62B3|nr:CBBY-like protein isoform X2 [Malania oleifera]
MASATLISPPFAASSSSSSYSTSFPIAKTPIFTSSPHHHETALSSSLFCQRICILGARTKTRSPMIAGRRRSGVICSASSGLPPALLFDCDGVLVDTEKDGHRVSFNDTFAQRELGVTWGVDLYGELLKIGGGKERLTFTLTTRGWPEMLQVMRVKDNILASRNGFTTQKTELFMALIEKKLLPLRPGVAKLIDQALAKGVKVAVCSTSNEKAVFRSRNCFNALWPERRRRSDFAGDVVARKKPDPAIYLLAASTLGVEPSSCVVVEDSAIGLAAAKAAEMKCIVTKSGYTADEDFLNADAVFDCIGDPPEERFDLAFCGSLLERQYVS